MRDLERNEAAVAVTTEVVGAVRADRTYRVNAVGSNGLHGLSQRALREPVKVNGIDRAVRVQPTSEIIGIEAPPLVIVHKEEGGMRAGPPKHSEPLAHPV